MTWTSPRRKPAGKRRCLVTGGAGFLGRHLVSQLLASGGWEVTVFDVRSLEGEDGTEGAQYVVGDLRDPQQVADAVQGMDTVFHVATAAPTAHNTHNEALMRDVNVAGTRHVIDACVAASVPRLVYTSSASVVFNGANLFLVDEAAPYAKPMDFYTHTKTEAEKLVLAANGRGGLATCALRPSGIFGEHDTLLVATTVRNAARGKLKYVIGNGRNEMDWTYAGNVAQAHLEAAEALTGPDCPLGGRPYFITNAEPRPFWGFMGDVCEGMGYPRPHIRLPFFLVYFIALVVQFVVVPLCRLLGRDLQSDFTPSRIKITAANRTFSCAAARRDFGYRPKVSVDEGLRRTMKHFAHLHASKQKKG